MDHAGKVDAAASAPAAFRPRQSNVVARAKGDDKPRDASKDLAATNPESRAENPDPVAPANPTDGDENAPEEEDAEEDAPEEDAPAAAAADDDASASSSSASSSSGPAPAASKNRDALRAVVDNAEVLCLVAAGGVKAAQMRARLTASPRDFASSSTSRLVAARASAPPPPSLPAHADVIADGALFGVMAVGAVLRRAGVINNVVPKRVASRRRGVENVVDVVDAEAETQLTDVVERVRARAARLAEVKKTLADSRSDLKRAAEAATAATAAAKAKAAEAEAADAKAAATAAGPSIVAEADARAPRRRDDARRCTARRRPTRWIRLVISRRRSSGRRRRP